jgi:serine/threonine protein kinase
VFLSELGSVKDFIKILDFGISKMQTLEDNKLTMTGEILGTPHHMSPEQAQGESTIDGRTDVYSLGAILYEMLTGRQPFVGPTPIQVISQLLFKEPEPPSRVTPGLPPELDGLVLRALAKSPDARYPSMQAFADAIDEMLLRLYPAAGASTLAVPTPPPTPSPGIGPTVQFVSPHRITPPTLEPVAEAAAKPYPATSHSAKSNKALIIALAGGLAVAAAVVAIAALRARDKSAQIHTPKLVELPVAPTPARSPLVAAPAKSAPVPAPAGLSPTPPETHPAPAPEPTRVSLQQTPASSNPPAVPASAKSEAMPERTPASGPTAEDRLAAKPHRPKHPAAMQTQKPAKPEEAPDDIYDRRK